MQENGVLKLLSKAGYWKQGYFFLADGRGLLAHGVTFVLPRASTLGKHQLANPSPFDLGTLYSVRVYRDLGNAVASFDRNTTGFLNVTAFPNDENKLNGSMIAGKFAFESEDPKGRRVSVTGKFSFKIE